MVDPRAFVALLFAGACAMSYEADAPTGEAPTTFTSTRRVATSGDAPDFPILPPQYGLAQSARVDGVQLFQTLALDEALPLMARRPARVRVAISDAAGVALLGRVRWQSAGVSHIVATAFREQNDASWFMDFDIPAEWVEGAVDLEVELLEDEGRRGVEGADPARAVPQPWNAEEARIRVRLLPMRYHADGSGRLPELDAAALEAFEAHLEAVFPVSDAIVEVGEPFDYFDPIAPDVLDDHIAAVQEVMERRAAVPDEEVYYMALVAPAESYATYCALGCYAGIAPLNTSNVAFQRAGVTVWYGAEQSAWTALHELGHAHGRAHAPCGGVASFDEDYPHEDATLGREGFDARTSTYRSPSEHDFMSYCRDPWVSDYTYAGLADRIASVAARAWRARSAVPIPPSPHHVFTVSGDGVSHRVRTLAPSARERAVASDGTEVRAARVRYSEEGPWSLIVPVGYPYYEFAGRRFDVP